MATTPQDALNELKQKTREISILETCGALLDWDEHTYMPSKGSEFRAELAYNAMGKPDKKAMRAPYWANDRTIAG